MKSNRVSNSSVNLITAVDAEKMFGGKFFYRQKIYRLVKKGKLHEFNLRGKSCFVDLHILNTCLLDLELKIKTKFPEIDFNSVRLFFDSVHGKRIVIDGIGGRGISIDTEKENEEDLLKKLENILEWLGGESFDEISSNTEEEISDTDISEKSVIKLLPEEIMWLRVDESDIEDIQVKSFILVSLPSIARFLGVRSDHFAEWISSSTFHEYVLSLHIKQINGTEISGPWKKGYVRGYISFIPFELIPQLLVSFRESGRSIKYPQKAEILYELATSTLEAVGLAVSGNKDKAAEELAKVGRGLGINAADQVIAIFKQYETRDFQVKTTKEFQSLVKKSGASFAATIGSLTMGITNRYPAQWKLLGESRKLPKKITNSSREVMRSVSPENSVGMTFGEKHYIKDQNIEEATHTGKQGKDFYLRLKKVGLLED